jgi:hypothetical protein
MFHDGSLNAKLNRPLHMCLCAHVTTKGIYAACNCANAKLSTHTQHPLQILDLPSGKLFKSMQAAHSNIASCVSFRAHRPWEVVSAGLDQTVARWDCGASEGK